MIATRFSKIKMMIIWKEIIKANDHEDAKIIALMFGLLNVDSYFTSLARWVQGGNISRDTFRFVFQICHLILLISIINTTSIMNVGIATFQLSFLLGKD